MPNHVLSHDEFRKLVCGICLRKEKHKQTISDEVLALIKKHCYQEYSLESEYLPLVACKSCVSSLKAIDKNPENPKSSVEAFDLEVRVKFAPK